MNQRRHGAAATVRGGNDGGTVWRRRRGKNGSDGGSCFEAILEWFWMQFFLANMIELWSILGVAFKCFG